MDREKLIAQLVDREWEYFQKVQGIGGRAACQDDRNTFEIMRRSQFMVLPNEYLVSYAADLEDAAGQGRNPVAEKYAYMMRETDPEYFNSYLRNKLPLSSDAKKADIRRIAEISKMWDEELREKYPALASVCRPAQTSRTGVSPVSYLTCELETCSEKTVKAYLDYAELCMEKGRNIEIETLDETAKLYGYSGIADAEKKV